MDHNKTTAESQHTLTLRVMEASRDALKANIPGIQEMRRLIIETNNRTGFSIPGAVQLTEAEEVFNKLVEACEESIQRWKHTAPTPDALRAGNAVSLDLQTSAISNCHTIQTLITELSRRVQVAMDAHSTGDQSAAHDLLPDPQEKVFFINGEFTPPDGLTVPEDWDKPKWDEYNKVHCWRNYVSVPLKSIWATFSPNQKKVLATAFQALAESEEWD